MKIDQEKLLHDIQYGLDRDNSLLVKYIIDLPASLQLECVRVYWKNIQYINEASIEAQIMSVLRNPFAISHIKNPPPEIQFLAVRWDVGYLKYIENPAQEVKDYVEHQEYLHHYSNEPD